MKTFLNLLTPKSNYHSVCVSAMHFEWIETDVERATKTILLLYKMEKYFIEITLNHKRDA